MVIVNRRRSNVSKQRVVFLAPDGMRFDLVKHFVDRGHLPTFRGIMERGVAAELMPTLFPVTPNSWNSMLTGAWPQTHGVDFQMRLPGARMNELTASYMPEYCEAEFIFETAERNGKFPMIVHFPGTWGSGGPAVSKGIQVGGGSAGSLTVGQQGIFEIAPPTLFSTKPSRYQEARALDLDKASGVARIGLAGTEFGVAVSRPHSVDVIGPDNRRTKVLPGVWSSWQRWAFGDREGYIRFKLLRSSGDEITLLTGAKKVGERIFSSSCDYRFWKDKKYLVYAFGPPKVLKTHACSRTAEIKYRAEDVEELDKVKPPELKK